MTDEQVLDLFDANKVSPNLQRTSGSSSSDPVYFAGGYARSLEELKERNEAEPIGKQSGGRRTRNRKGKGRRSTYRRHRRSTYRRR